MSRVHRGGSVRGRLARLLVAPALLAAAAPLAPAQAQGDGLPAAAQAPRIEILSNRPALLSGGDALVEIVLPEGADPAALRVEVDGRDVSAAFAPRDGGRVIGLVEGLPVGDSTLRARVPGAPPARLGVTNHPIGGPVFAGPQVRPWVCSTEAHDLGPAQDEQCNGTVRYEYRYKSSITGLFRTFDPALPPPDIATVTTDQGNEVPFVVRIERGTMDRGIYEIGVLFDLDDPAWAPWAPQAGWNGKLHVPFGGNCEPRHEQTGPPGDFLPTDREAWLLHSVVLERALSRGFMVATSGLNVLGQNCNDVVSAEALMMLKEHIVETYGEIRYTTAEGCSGGSMQQHLIAANYPGLLDGIQPACSFPDIWNAVVQAQDCNLLQRVFDEVAPARWADPRDQAAAAGYASVGVCRSRWDGPVPDLSYADIWLNPRTKCSLPPEQVYDPETNPAGARCTLQDYQVALFGRRAADGFANRPYDNVGVQYGLAALESGAITPEQFVDLNANVGGIDIDWNWQPERSVADLAALRRAYRGGRVTHGAALASVPIVDLRGSSNYEVHSDVHSYMLRQRLVDANGHHGNQIIWSSLGAIPDQGSVEAAFVLLDRWLAAIEADGSGLPLADKVLRHKPSDAVDACWVGERRITDPERCALLFPYYATPRIAAGAPLSDDVLKCRLRPLDRRSYAVAFSDDQWDRLAAAFPDGVCDWTRPGVAQEPSVPWLDFSTSPDGQALPWR